jgi:hypothetical protein
MDYADAQLKAVAARLRLEGYTLAHLNIESDSNPVMIIPYGDSASLERLAAETGYGRLEIW